MDSPFLEKVLNYNESDIVNGKIDYQEILKIYQKWKKSESVIKEKNKDISSLKLRLKSYEEKNVDYRGQLQVKCDHMSIALCRYRLLCVD